MGPRGGFGGHLSWQTQYLVNVGRRFESIESHVIFDLGHDDDSMLRHFGFFMSGAVLCSVDLDKDVAEAYIGKTSFFRFSMFIFHGARSIG